MQSDIYSTDSPLDDRERDRFRRWPFAQRIAQTVATRRTPDSLAIGVYGKWGEGKTTVLRFIEADLRTQPHIVCVWFNPWRFRDDSTMLLNFFVTLADALDRRLKKGRERFGEWLAQYGQALPSIPVPGAGGMSTGSSAVGLGRVLSSVELEEYKRRLETALKEEEKRIVIFIDDIDRLDKKEIQTLFKIVKLSAGFDYTTYVMAFDPEIVAAAVGEQYGSGDPDDGRSFLEKIVQVPLNLPRADPLALRGICFDAVNQALRDSATDLTELDAQAFGRDFRQGFEPMLKTARVAKEYGNALSFALPLLRGEAHPLDVMEIEAVRIFYPRLYAAIREHPDVFLGTALDESVNAEDAKASGKQIIEEALGNLDDAAKEAAREVLFRLFPRIQVLYRNMHYGRDRYSTWAEQQRIASPHHFNRYFSYAILEDDISDHEVQALLRRAEHETPDSLSQALELLVSPLNADRFVAKARARVGSLSAAGARQLALALAMAGDVFPKVGSEDLILMTVFESAAVLVGDMVGVIPPGDDRLRTAAQVLNTAEPLGFAALCFRWMPAKKDEEPGKGTFSKVERATLGRTLAARLADAAMHEPPYVSFPDEAQSLLYVWSKYGPEGEADANIRAWLRHKPQGALDLLKCYSSRASSDGISWTADFEEREYRALAEVVDPAVVYEALGQVGGFDLFSESYPRHLDRTAPVDQRLAEQFAFLHRHRPDDTDANDGPGGRQVDELV